MLIPPVICRTACWGGVLLLIVSAAGVRAAPQTASPSPDESAERWTLSQDELAELVRQLESRDFADRRAASQVLGEIGPAAVPVLESAAREGSREASSRALEILARYALSRTSGLQTAALESLRNVSALGPAGAAVAARQHLRSLSRQLGHDVLKPPVAPAADAPALAGDLPGLRFGGLVPPGLALPVNPGDVPARGLRRVDQTLPSGIREIKTEQAGQAVIVRISPDGSTRIEVTRKGGAPEQARRYEGKDLAALRQDPVAAQLYDLYGPDWKGVPAAQAQEELATREALRRFQQLIDDRIQHTRQALQVTDNPQHAEALRRQLERYGEQKLQFEEISRQLP